MCPLAYSFIFYAHRSKTERYIAFFSITPFNMLLATLYINYHIIVVLLRINRSKCTTDQSVRSIQTVISPRTNFISRIDQSDDSQTNSYQMHLSKSFRLPSSGKERAYRITKKKKTKKRREIYGIHRRETGAFQNQHRQPVKRREEIEFLTS